MPFYYHMKALQFSGIFTQISIDSLRFALTEEKKMPGLKSCQLCGSRLKMDPLHKTRPPVSLFYISNRIRMAKCQTMNILAFKSAAPALLYTEH